MIFTIRVDDVGWTATPADEAPLKLPDASLELARRFHAALGGLPWLAAVIPATLDRDGAKWLRDNRGDIELAIHGWDHRRVDGLDSEFRGIPEERCRAMLRHGLEVVEAPVRHFVPPFNALEPELASALPKEGFEVLWGGISDAPEVPFTAHGMAYIPAWRRLYGATRRRMSGSAPPLIGEIPPILDAPGFAVITLHLTWEAAAFDGFAGVRELAGLIRHNTVSSSKYLEIAK